MPCRPRALAAIVASALVCAPAPRPAHAQQSLSRPLGNFSVRLTQPLPDSIVGGRIDLRAEVQADRPEDVLFVEFLVDGRMLFADSEPPYELVWNSREPAAHRITVRAYGAAGQVVEHEIATVAPPAGQTEASFASRVDRVEVYVRVEDRKHKGLALGIDDFAILENDIEQRVLEVQRSENLPLAVGFMVDCSGSMLDRIGMALETAGSFIDGLMTQGNDKAFVMAFSDLPSMLQEFTDDSDRLASALDLISVGRYTKLYDSIVAASAQFDGHEGRRALVLLTDGHDGASEARLDDAVAAALRYDVAIYPVAVGVTTSLFHERWVLERLAERTGGRIAYLHSLDNPERIYESIAADLRSQYRITYTPSVPAGDGGWRPILVALNDSSGHGHARLRSRPGYFAE